MFQRLISEQMQTTVSKCDIPEKIKTGGGGGGLKTYFF